MSYWDDIKRMAMEYVAKSRANKEGATGGYWWEQAMMLVQQNMRVDLLNDVERADRDRFMAGEFTSQKAARIEHTKASMQATEKSLMTGTNPLSSMSSAAISTALSSAYSGLQTSSETQEFLSRKRKQEEEEERRRQEDLARALRGKREEMVEELSLESQPELQFYGYSEDGTELYVDQDGNLYESEE